MGCLALQTQSAVTEVSQQRFDLDITKRGVYLGDLLDFFVLHCGDIAYEEEQLQEPHCQATKLARQCVLYNQQNHLQIMEGTTKLSEPNLYAVNRFYILAHTKALRISMAELWNQGSEATVEVFMSHYWGEDFGEFVQSTFRWTLQYTSRIHDTTLVTADVVSLARKVCFYICAFSNNQHNLAAELGQSIKTSPFYRVLSAASTKVCVMNVDQCVSALSRAWCALEFCLVHQLKKPFILNTRFGELKLLAPDSNMAKIWVKHMFEILEVMNISKSIASNQTDLDMIMCYINLFESHEGIGTKGLNSILKRTIADQVLGVAALDSKPDFVQRALALRADPNFLDHQGLPALVYAVATHGEDSEVVKVLQAAGARPVSVADAVLLVEMFSPEANIRAAAIEQVDFLRSGCQTNQEFVFLNALRLAQTKDKLFRTKQLRQQLFNSDPRERVRAIEGLSKLPFEAALFIGDLAKALHDSNSDVRYQAALAIGEMGDHALPHIQDLSLLCGDQEGGVCYAAVEALRKLDQLVVDGGQ